VSASVRYESVVATVRFRVLKESCEIGNNLHNRGEVANRDILEDVDDDVDGLYLRLQRKEVEKLKQNAESFATQLHLRFCSNTIPLRVSITSSLVRTRPCTDTREKRTE